MSEAINQAGSRFIFEINEDDNRNFQKLTTRNIKRYIDRRIIMGVPLATFFVLFGVLFAAYIRDLLAGSAVFTAEVAFAAGYISLLISGKMILPGMQKAIFKETPDVNRRFECAFDDKGIAVKIGLRATWMPWDAISWVEDAQSMVAFWYQPGQGFFIPSRAFSDDPARTAFAAWAVARVPAKG